MRFFAVTLVLIFTRLPIRGIGKSHPTASMHIYMASPFLRLRIENSNPARPPEIRDFG